MDKKKFVRSRIWIKSRGSFETEQKNDNHNFERKTGSRGVSNIIQNSDSIGLSVARIVLNQWHPSKCGKITVRRADYSNDYDAFAPVLDKAY